LLGSALLAAWLLELGQDLCAGAGVERMGADLRSTTYEHDRTVAGIFWRANARATLMSRIGSGPSDRISSLSLHLLDFASDVLMIMTGA
jgi:ATP-binding cassette subfamily B protein